MCLDTLSCKSGEMIGYKHFDESEGKPLLGFSASKKIQIGRWLTASDNILVTDSIDKQGKNINILQDSIYACLC